MSLDRSRALGAIRNAGVVGAGGAGFPTYKKLESPAEHLIANGAECEPLLYKDREVMLQRPEQLVRGLAAMQELTGARHVTIAVKRKNADVLESLAPAAAAAGFDLFTMEDVYPAGDEYVLVHDITGRRMRPGGIPIQVGVVVDNVETIVNVANALEGRPVTEKFLTVAGAVRFPVTVSVPVGTSFAECLELAGGVTVPDPVILTGGVMMGGLETDASLPVTKTTAGLIVLPRDHPLVLRKATPPRDYQRTGHSTCDQCMLCTELCPRYILGYPIEPHRVMRSLLMTGEERDRLSLWAEFCCECNICSLFACPEKLDPKNICVDAKRRLKEQKLARTSEEIDRLFNEVHGMRQGRQIPIAMLYQRLGLRPYDRAAHYSGSPRSSREVTLPLDTHMGTPATPTVSVGAPVRRGDPVAAVAPDRLGCPVHASIDGTVTAIDSKTIRIQASA